jgi:hypothetical protein
VHLKISPSKWGRTKIRDNTGGKAVRVDESRLLFENFHENKEWFIYEGDHTLTAVFEDNSRQTFKLHFRQNRLREDKEKHRKKAASVWKRMATQIRKSAGIGSSGNPVIIPWQECFQKASESPEMLEYIDDLRSSPIFESWMPIKNYWLAPDGRAHSVSSHAQGATDIINRLGKRVGTGYRTEYDALYRLGYARVIVGDNANPLIVDTGADAAPRLTKAQRAWVEDQSYALGLDGEYSTAYGRTVNLESVLDEMTYDELHQSMQKYRTRADIRKGTATGSDSRDDGSKQVNVRSLRVISTIGRDGNEHETSMFSYKSRSGNPSDARTSHPRWQGFIRFIENSKGGAVAPTKDHQDVEVNCNCPDYRFVWAKANSDADAGTTAKDGGTTYHTQATGKPVNIFEGDEVAPVQAIPTDKRWNSGAKTGSNVSRAGGNDNNGTYGKRIRNPNNVPGLCKHLIALADYIEKKTTSEPVAPPEAGKEEPAVVAKPSKLKKTGKPVNIFEGIKKFALENPTFDVPYDD